MALPPAAVALRAHRFEMCVLLRLKSARCMHASPYLQRKGRAVVTVLDGLAAPVARRLPL
jgi:hypothetical protein